MSEHTIESTPKYAVGDVVNNHRLNADGTWSPLVQAPPPPVAQITPATLSQIILPSKKKSFGKRLVVGLVVGFMLLVVGGIVAGMAGGSKSGGSSTDTVTVQDYNDPAFLAASIKEKVTEQFTKDGVAASATNVMCIPTAVAHQFSCNVEATNGEHNTVTATVAPDGKSWVTGS